MTAPSRSWEDVARLPRIVLTETSTLLPLLREAKRFRLGGRKVLSGWLSALAAEGRQYGQTAEGAELRRRLDQSELLSRARILWQALGLDALIQKESPAAGMVLEPLLDELLGAHLESLVAGLSLDEHD